MNRIINTLAAFVSITLVLTLVNGCKPDDETPAPIETGTMTDVENHVYQTVKIGNQWWMAEDLKVTKYRNGISILQVTNDSVQWKTDTTGAYCDNKVNQNTIGKFYNWYAIHNSNQIAPAGWHIPTDNEWKELEKAVGMSATEADKSGWRGSHEGEKLKSVGLQNWTEYKSIWGTNESGFSAHAPGCRLFDLSPGDPGYFATGFWWTATSRDNDAYYRYLDYKTSTVFRSHCLKNYGFSIRCVKD